MSHKVHPAAALFPLMEGAAFAELKADIEKHGQREPVVFYRGQLLDGRNRARACGELKIQVSECELDDEIDPIAYVLSANLHRRHLNESQRATVAAKLKKMLEPAAKDRQRDGQKSGGRGKKKNLVANLPPSNGKSRDQAAAMLNVSGKSVDHASTVLDKGSPELIGAVERGEVAVSRAATIAKSTPKKQQLAAANQKPTTPDKTPLDHLKHWWAKADATQQCLFRNWIDGTL